MFCSWQLRGRRYAHFGHSPLPNTHDNTQIGDHVRVLNGAHKGETGMVVQVEHGVCAVVGDATRTQFRVNARDLTENVEQEPGLEVRFVCCVLLCEWFQCLCCLYARPDW